MSDDDERILIDESDDGSNSASVGSRISDDSGIEDWSDDMTVQTNQKESVAITFEEKNNSPNQSDSYNSPTKHDCIFPMLPEFYTPSEHIQKDIIGDSAVSGICGLNNLGNTCFMNAALQCIIATPMLDNLFWQGDILQNGSAYMHEPSSVLLFVERFQEMFHKVQSGKYLTLHPDELHASIARLHPAFGDLKQHDSQEFLSFLLNTLHDFLNKSPNRLQHRNGTSDDSVLSLENSSKHQDVSQTITGDVSKRVKLESEGENSVTMETDAGVECEENISKTESAWREYINDNQSIIADSLQGQFHSVITCEKCAYVSNTYEPFMFLSLPIPHAMEKQIEITWLPSPKLSLIPGMMSAKRFLVTTNKNDCIKEIKSGLMTLLKKEDFYICSNDVVLAEVQNSSNVTILDDRTQITYLSKTKKLYAIEIMRNCANKLEIGDEAIQSNIFPNQDIESIVDSKITDDTEHSDDSLLNKESAWHTCRICLEETFDEELRIHLICGGLLCADCLTKSTEYYNHSSFPCPICNQYISSEDYTHLVKQNEDKEIKKLRQVLAPVMFRHKNTTKNIKKFQLFGHPLICSLLSQMVSVAVLELINQILQQWTRSPTNIDVVITDGTGLSCGICDMFSSCNGCLVKDFETVQLKPGTCITVHFNDIGDIVNTMCILHDDKSMLNLRTSDSVLLNECIETFAETEVLTEDNPWFCPQCQRNQVSIKTMTVSRWPDILIIHLKRFYHEGSHGCKITCPVDFPLTDLNVDTLTCVEGEAESRRTSTLYDMYACICHTGSLFGGHYTSLAKPVASSEWYCFNDETVSQVTFNEEFHNQAYALFYQRKGSQK